MASAKSISRGGPDCPVGCVALRDRETRQFGEAVRELRADRDRMVEVMRAPTKAKLAKK